eukprot:CAMPEP_0178992294 /NCGR_PEP_ID=MMETSP0795-20121207/6030_1 /TAXON_ID=88552 /ORGANISM="Amoebophrya sp., Strain Ameob2" /LENGTH=889 /DNA_ID=CAMNT_0020684151 /DNA_START=85 /DNA_END=2754 /DNA_ORIENTATION=-
MRPPAAPASFFVPLWLLGRFFVLVIQAALLSQHLTVAGAPCTNIADCVAKIRDTRCGTRHGKDTFIDLCRTEKVTSVCRLSEYMQKVVFPAVVRGTSPLSSANLVQHSSHEQAATITTTERALGFVKWCERESTCADRLIDSLLDGDGKKQNEKDSSSSEDDDRGPPLGDNVDLDSLIDSCSDELLRIFFLGENYKSVTTRGGASDKMVAQNEIPLRTMPRTAPIEASVGSEDESSWDEHAAPPPDSVTEPVSGTRIQAKNGRLSRNTGTSAIMASASPGNATTSNATAPSNTTPANATTAPDSNATQSANATSNSTMPSPPEASPGAQNSSTTSTTSNSTSTTSTVTSTSTSSSSTSTTTTITETSSTPTTTSTTSTEASTTTTTSSTSTTATTSSTETSTSTSSTAIGSTASANGNLSNAPTSATSSTTGAFIIASDSNPSSTEPAALDFSAVMFFPASMLTAFQPSSQVEEPAAAEHCSEAFCQSVGGLVASTLMAVSQNAVLPKKVSLTLEDCFSCTVEADVEETAGFLEDLEDHDQGQAEEDDDILLVDSNGRVVQEQEQEDVSSFLEAETVTGEGLVRREGRWDGRAYGASGPRDDDARLLQGGRRSKVELLERSRGRRKIRRRSRGQYVESNQDPISSVGAHRRRPHPDPLRRNKIGINGHRSSSIDHRRMSVLSRKVEQAARDAVEPLPGYVVGEVEFALDEDVQEIYSGAASTSNASASAVAVPSTITLCADAFTNLFQEEIADSKADGNADEVGDSDYDDPAAVVSFFSVPSLMEDAAASTSLDIQWRHCYEKVPVIAGGLLGGGFVLPGGSYPYLPDVERRSRAPGQGAAGGNATGDVIVSTESGGEHAFMLLAALASLGSCVLTVCVLCCQSKQGAK